ncbi:hypothetical protein M406DRAFT_65422 [Cryphonectria parasitica EP155]|uniref:Uncharacterized protein n=1 Tax=Cryphonectria parasitica (strain ATCC 38755 / EP155) TaxID=660469 RepID=A0A9P4Y7Z1_CRYP1|nr:uncharacterized protein M406DRAFT_65422 [Cryphonectria parasitica EP155]KAF3768203.1 hypothetical protein M406DRAFT_65422 [Cryphonectria parasitica EP155]
MSRASTAAGDEPTDEEKRTLRKVSDKLLPWSAFLVCVVELCKRFTYYGFSGPFQNYIENKYGGTLPGAIGMGQTAATGLTDFFQFWCYVTPVLGAIVSDQYLSNCLILFLTSLPVAIENSTVLGGLIAAMIIIGYSTGGIKSNISPLIAEQYENTTPFIKTLKSGERIIIDPATTIKRIFMPLQHRHHRARGLHRVLSCLPPPLPHSHYKMRPSQESVISKAFRVLWIAMRNKGNLDAAKPQYHEELAGGARGGALAPPPSPGTASFVDKVKRAIVACKASQITLHSIPNNLMQNWDPITIIIFIPICNYFLYPSLARLGFQIYPVTRIFWSFMLGTGAMAYAAGMQKLIYESGPCYNAPAACPAALEADGSYTPNNVHIAIQAPAYLLIGLSEIFASITGLDFIISLFLLTSAFGSALSIALSPTAVDPKLLWMYTGLAVACFVAGVVFWLLYSRCNDTEEAINELDKYTEKPKHVGEKDEEDA